MRKPDSCIIQAKNRPSIFSDKERIDEEILITVAKTILSHMTHHVSLKNRLTQEISKLKASGKDSSGYGDDPWLSYAWRCQESDQLSLPALDKIYRKTLCLQDYLD